MEGFPMSENSFVDYCEVLQLSSGADADTIERVFRHLAMKYHPDNKESGDSERFRLLVEAHKTLSDSESRAGYDVRHRDYWNMKWKLASEANGRTSFGDDTENRENLLSLLYVQRRRDMKKPGLGDYELARLLCVPVELMEFHLWYLKEKGWVERLDTGQLAISALGVDQVEQGQLRFRKDRMLTTGDISSQSEEGGTAHLRSADLPAFASDASE